MGEREKEKGEGGWRVSEGEREKRQRFLLPFFSGYVKMVGIKSLEIKVTTTIKMKTRE